MTTVVESRKEPALESRFTGQVLLDNPLLNKGSAFPEDEHREFGLLGVLPTALFDNCGRRTSSNGSDVLRCCPSVE